MPIYEVSKLLGHSSVRTPRKHYVPLLVSEIKDLSNEILQACRFLPDKNKHEYLLSAPVYDSEGNPYVIRYNRNEDVHYVASEKDGKKTKWTAAYTNGEWLETKK